MVNYDVAALTNSKNEAVKEHVLSTGECAPSILDAMILGLKCGPAEVDHLFVVPVAHQDEVPGGSGNCTGSFTTFIGVGGGGGGGGIFQSASLDGTLNGTQDDSDSDYEDSVQEIVHPDMGYYLDKYIDNIGNLPE
jgi:hypothetical protein